MQKQHNSLLLDRFEGAILGAAFGDALGWPHEARARRTPSQQSHKLDSWKKRSGGRFNPHEEAISAGSYSDDTQLIIAVARSRLTAENWWTYLAFTELPFWLLYNRGAGGASLRASRLLSKHVLPWESSSSDQEKYYAAGGNGAAMRVAPHSLLGASDEDFRSVARNVLADSVLTHGNSVALVGALAYAYALWVALRKTDTLEYGQLLEEVRTNVSCWAEIPDLIDMWPTWAAHAKTSTYEKDWRQSVDDLLMRLEFARGGLATGALDFDDEILLNIGCFDPKINGAGTVSAAAAIFLASKYAISPMEGVTRAAFAKGADTDTIASMTGAILGGINGGDWLLKSTGPLQDRRFLLNLAKWLCGSQLYNRYETSDRSADSNVAVLQQLLSGSQEISLPIGSRARVVGDGGVTSKSDKLFVDSWKLEDDKEQTFFIKLITRTSASRPDHSSQQKHFDLGATVEKKPSVLAGISLLTNELLEAKNFYGSVLGLSITKDSGDVVHLGSNIVLRSRGGTSIGEGTIVYVSVNDISGCWQKLRGLAYAHPSKISFKSGRQSFQCHDPDGRTVEIFEN